jgi:hypothetical protein
MSLSELTKKYVETKMTEYCNNRIPKHIRDKIKMVFKINRNNVTLFETRPFYADPSVWTENPVAQFRYDEYSKKWTLYCADRNSKWHIYLGIKPRSNMEDLLKEVDLDPTHTFYG